jgi:TnpA family transposase
MQYEWPPDDQAPCWTLSADERSLLSNKTGATRLAFALLLKAFQVAGRFPDRREDIAEGVVAHVAAQVGVSPDTCGAVQWNERTQRHHRAQIREYCGFRAFRADDERSFVAWLSTCVTSFDPDAEPLIRVAYRHLRAQQVEPPPPRRLRRLVRAALHIYEERLVATVAAQLPPATCAALDALIQTAPDEGEDDQAPLFPIRSELAALKEDAGAVKVETVREEIEKLRQIRALALPARLFRDVPSRFVTHYRQRAASEKPRELRRHPPAIRYTLLAALCWQRAREITDTLVDLLLHIAHRIGARAEAKVEETLHNYVKKLVGKPALLYKLAKAAKERPDGIVKEVIYPVVSEQALDAVIAEAEADAGYARRVKLVTRSSYSHHYRRIVPTLLEELTFQCTTLRHQPVMGALALLQRYRGSKTTVFPQHENVPLDGVVKDDWQDLVLDERRGGRVNRISYEICLLTTLREKVRCKEIWVAGALRYRDPDDDVPQDFAARRDEYCDALAQPRAAAQFVTQVQQAMITALVALDADLPHNTKAKILTAKTGKGRIALTPLIAQAEPPTLTQLTAALVQHWPMTNLLDILKETELRVHFTEAFRTLGSREALDPDVLQRRLLLCLHGLGTNAGLKRMCSGGSGETYADLAYVRRRYITKEQLRTAIAKVCNAIFAVRHVDLWGTGTTACASDSKRFGAWDQNLMTEWHARYGGPGVMIYYHVERHSVCIYSQLKSCSSSEVAAMIEGVLRHDTEMEVDKNYVDTHGQSEVGFAFCHLLGFHLLPRLKNLRKQRLYRPTSGEPAAYANLQPLLTRPINWAIIEQQYDELIKFASALRLGTADAEAILRRFTRSNVQHPTYKALCELGKALKTTFLCEYLRLESLRREIHEGLAVIETWNSANDFILYGKGGEFASNKTEDHEVLMLSLHLLQVSLVYVNTLMIQQVLAQPDWHGRLTPPDLRALTPLKWQHINPYGTFTLDMQRRLRLELAA